MRVNLPVTQQEFDFPADEMIVSATDTRGYITHCNDTFVKVSGYTFEELMGANHNILRHPDMPALGFKDLWRTIGHGKPWTGVVKNRRKNGDHYWVVANVTPIMRDGKPIGYLSVRTKPTRAQIEATNALYTTINNTPDPATLPVYLSGGVLYAKGLAGLVQKVGRTSLTQRLAAGLALLSLVGTLPMFSDLQGFALVGMQLGTLAVGSAALWWWFHLAFTRSIESTRQFADDLAGCNLASSAPTGFVAPLDGLVRSLLQIQINLRAVVGDVRSQIDHFTRTSGEIAEGATNLSDRTEAQASSLQQTSATMGDLADSVREAANTIERISQQSQQSNTAVSESAQAMDQVSQAMQEITQSSTRMNDIIGVIESIAFQTNLLALNAAVEAARAGEQGRGFAVVASEVRALAQRSAGAAHEIRELIAQSSQQIARGSHDMHIAADTVHRVTESVQEVSGLITQFDQSSHTQAQSIANVNVSVQKLDDMTQQNAALAEESAASAEGLKSGAVALARSVQVFHMP
jgi:aerotaxis receptor